jgi:ribonuclease HII
MVLCAAYSDDPEIEPKLRALGVKDSKLLTPKRREELSQILLQHVHYSMTYVQPDEIDAAVLSTDGMNLNWLEAVTTVSILKGIQPDKAIVDCPSPNLTAYRDYILKRWILEAIFPDGEEMPRQPIIQAEHKADVNYAIVGAASILAKVARDAEIARLRQKVKYDFGSGYLSDPKTKKFLEEKWNIFPQVFRKSWAPYQTLSLKGNQ